MPGYQPVQSHYSEKTIAKCVKARKTMEEANGKKKANLTEQQKKDYKNLCKVIHNDDSGDHPTSQELQNIYNRTSA
jgi:hypothetical protein